MTAPADRPRPPRRIVLVAGPSGSGKGVMSRRSGLPTVPLDEFYRDHDDPSLPHRFGIVDWDDTASWNGGAALEALVALAHDGVAEVPVYSIPESRRLGTTTLDASDADLIIAEGIFAAELIAPLARLGLMADAIVLQRPVPVVFSLRLARDLREGRKAPLTLLRRGWALAGEQKGDIRRWLEAGMRPVGLHQGTALLQRLTCLAAAERHHHRPGSPASVLEITAVAFVREGAAGTELLAVRKRGTGSYMQVGGKLEPGESAREAALREVAEEIGVTLEESDLEPLGEFEAVAANEPGTRVRSTVFRCAAALPEPLEVRAELAEHRWIPLDGPTGAAGSGGSARLAPLMTEHIMPTLRRG
ncbi:NUDIX domain-containing protein [Brachybacterium aquaticum]|uniref:Uridine kinase n=1 Tax=Brachybacterium aquaticum TaxID=1432564 RepID=A0A841AB78_9MICO|nr:NUDIX domain-containing protein [Brachybacterium aquaticum]MBB5830881.1 uridine kinase [Brachybacterium aquaticum]